MSYSSSIDLGGLGEVPKTTDEGIFPDLVDIYNAIHILAQYTNSMFNRTDDASFDQITLSSANINVKAGDIVTISSLFGDFNANLRPNTLRKGMTKGAIEHGFSGVTKISYGQRYVSSGGEGGNWISVGTPFAAGSPHVGALKTQNTPGSFVISQFNGEYVGAIVGIVLEDAGVGAEVGIGTGKGIIEMEGARVGQIVYAAGVYAYDNLGRVKNNSGLRANRVNNLYSNNLGISYLNMRGVRFSNNGNMYLLNRPPSRNHYYPVGVPIGVCFEDDWVLLDLPRNQFYTPNGMTYAAVFGNS